MEIQELHPNPLIDFDDEKVFKMMDCPKTSPAYPEVAGEYERLKPWLYTHVRPAAVIAKEPWSKSLEPFFEGPVSKDTSGLMYLVMTIGESPERYTSELFNDGEYLSGMLLNVMADEYLFAMETALMPRLKAFCAAPGLGVSRRMEAPADLSMDIHRYVFEHCQLEKRLGLGLSSGLMFAPVKTSCVVFELTDDPKVFHAWHDCSRCPAHSCPRRSVPAGVQHL